MHPRKSKPVDSPQILIVLDEEQEDLFRAASEVRYLGAGHFCGGGRGRGHREVSPSSLSVSTSSFFRLRFPIHRTNIPHRTHVCLSPPLILGTEGGILRRDSRLGEEVDARMTSRDFFWIFAPPLLPPVTVMLPQPIITFAAPCVPPRTVRTSYENAPEEAKRV